MNAQEWFNLGSYQTIAGHKVFVIDSAESENLNHKPNLCILHGFPTSSFDYWKVLAKLSESYRVVIHDHLGFGYSDKPKNYSYSLMEQTDIALEIWKNLGIQKTKLIAHDYGTSILTELLARDNSTNCPIQIERVVLCNGSMHIELAQLLLMQKLLRNAVIGPILARLTNKVILRRNLKNIYFDPNKLSQQEIDDIWYMMNINDGKKVIAKISRYTFERKHFWQRWIGALQETSLPIEIIWPKNDPIAIAKMATVIKQETQNSNLHWLPELGHFPMLEGPQEWVTKVLEVLKN